MACSQRNLRGLLCNSRYHHFILGNSAISYLLQDLLRLCQWSFLVPLIGGRWYIITQLAIYKWYISGIYCQLGDYISPIPPIKGTRNSYWLCTGDGPPTPQFHDSFGHVGHGVIYLGAWLCFALPEANRKHMPGSYPKLNSCFWFPY